jgi:DNA (cytosine-5)-methyltransferase 1
MIRLDTDQMTARTTYTLSKAAELVGVSSITLKRWLLQGKVAEVGRDRNGWRVFSDSDVRRIRDYSDQAVIQEDASVNDATGSGNDTSLNGTNGHHRRFKAVSLFSGIGGFDIGFEKAGFDITFQCEILPFCNAILKKHWPDVPRWADIKELNKEKNHERIPVSDVWIGGFPCQDVSLARMGQRSGLGGSRSGLFYEFAGLLGKKLPRVFVLENVQGLLSSHRGEDFRIVLSTLAELGYAVGWRTLNSRNFGVPQSRQRVYIVGCYRDWTGPGRILFEPERSERHAAKNGSNGEESLSPFKRSIGEARKGRPVVQSIAYCLYACSARHTGTDWSRTYVPYPVDGKVRRLTPSECEGIMAFPKGWTIPQNGDFRGADLDSLRYHALGNAVTPPVLEWIGRRVYSYLLAPATASTATVQSVGGKRESKYALV